MSFIIELELTGLISFGDWLLSLGGGELFSGNSKSTDLRRALGYLS